MTIAVILAGGFGTRLRSAISDVPKPMAPIHNRPFLEYLMDYWIGQGVSQFILSVGYKSNIIINHFGSGYKGIPIFYIEENEPLGTGGALVLAAQRLTTPFLLLNGDTYFEVSLEELRYFHKKSHSDWTIALFRANEANRYGAITIEPDGKITQLKTAKCQVSEFANGGVYLINPLIVASSLFESGKKYSLEDEVMSILIDGGKNIVGIEQAGIFLDIGIPADYISAKKIIQFNQTRDV